MSDKTSSLVFLNYLTTVFDNIHDAILLIGVEPDDQFRVLLVNAAFARSTGSLESPVGKTIEDYIDLASYARVLPRYKKVVTTKQTLEFVDWYDVPLGRQVYEVTLIPILNAVGQCVQIATISRNITDAYTLREENKKLRALLRKRK